MSNIRVYELARDIGVTSKHLVEELRGQGIDVKSHMSTLDNETAELVLEMHREDSVAVVMPESKSKTQTEPAVEAETAQATLTPVTEPDSDTPDKTAVAAPPDSGESTVANENGTAAVAETAEATSHGTVIHLPEAVTVKDFAEALKLSPREVLIQLMSLGTMANINQVIDLNMANAVIEKMGKDITLVAEGSNAADEIADAAEEEYLETRAPVVTIMGHVDHGKTSLLDALREANVQATEMGGITQHIGAYEVGTDRGRLVFLDTPGHEAFTAMRARGAQVTDIVVLVVAANDGVMPQTREAVAHAKAAEVPIVVAVNKIDLDDANPDRVKQQLSEMDLIPEEWGGNTIFVEVSAKEHYGLDELLEMILLQAEILELQADPTQMARGTIVESRLDKSKGPIATILIQRGTLKVGNPFVAGVYNGRVRAMFDHRGRNIKAAGPATPVEVLGVSGAPAAGDTFMEVADERQARQISSVRQDQQRTKQLSQSSRVTLDDLYQRIAAGDVKDLFLIVKADVQGSVQAIWEAISKIESDKVNTRLVHGSTGGITESDINLASASNAIVLGFNVRPTPQAAELAAQEKVDVRLYGVIYEAISDVRNAMEGLLDPTFTEKTMGRAEVRQVFNISRVGTIAGCYMQEGSMRRNAAARVIRDSVVVHEGRVGSLRRVKDDVEEVAMGFECGIGLQRYQDLKEGDIIESYVLEEAAPRL